MDLYCALMCSVAATTVAYEREDIQQLGETTSITLKNHYTPQRVVPDDNVLLIVAIT